MIWSSKCSQDGQVRTAGFSSALLMQPSLYAHASAATAAAAACDAACNRAAFAECKIAPLPGLGMIIIYGLAARLGGGLSMEQHLHPPVTPQPGGLRENLLERYQLGLPQSDRRLLQCATFIIPKTTSNKFSFCHLNHFVAVCCRCHQSEPIFGSRQHP